MNLTAADIEWWRRRRRGGGRPLVLPGSLVSPLVLTRAQASGAKATATGADGLTWAEYAADVARFNGPSRRLLIEGQRTNSLRNPRCEGSASPSTLPTYWTFDGDAAGSNGLSLAVVSSGSDAGVDYVTVEISGTTTSTVGRMVNFEGTSQVSAAAGEVWTSSVFVMLEPGFAHTPDLPSLQLRNFTPDSASPDTTGTNFAPTGEWRRVVSTRTMPASTTSIMPRIRISGASVGLAIVTRIRIGWPQAELGFFASTPILPAVGTPAASTRGADMASATLASLGITGPCTILWSGVLPAIAGAEQYLFQLDDGTDANRVSVLVQPTGLLRVRSPSTLRALAGTVVATTPFAVGLSLDGIGGGAIQMAGEAVASLTGLLTGLSTLRLGNNASGSAPMFGEAGTLVVLPCALSDADLAARVASLPL